MSMNLLHHRRGFSLIELLIAIFILGIGIISIAAIFPAGISQQQRTVDDIIGPIAAHNALTLLRSRLEQEDFGLCEEFDPPYPIDPNAPKKWSPFLCEFSLSETNVNPWPTQCGDWMWRRPAIFESDHSDLLLRGSIDIFGESETGLLAEQWYPESVPGIPYNTERYHSDPAAENPSPRPPVIRISAGERQYPMWDGDPRYENANVPIPFDINDRPSTAYYWDCMFRRYEGKILVAVFVYRVVESGSQDVSGAYVVDTYDPNNPGIHMATPDFPRHINLDWPNTLASTGAWNARDSANPGVDPEELLIGTENDNPLFPEHQWQYPGQWIVDQNGHVHKVQRGRRRESDPPVKLASPPIEIQADQSPTNVNWWSDNSIQPQDGGFMYQGVVTDIWFLPTRDTLGRSIIPVFATVQEL